MLKYFTLKWMLLGSFMLCFTSILNAESVLQVSAINGKEKLESHLLYYAPQANQADSTILNGAADAKFIPFSSDKIPDQAATFWLKLNVQNNSDTLQHLYIGTSKFDYLTFYILGADGSKSVQQTGTLYPNQLKQLNHGPFSFGELVIPAAKNAAIYMKVVNTKVPTFQFIQLAPTIFQADAYKFEHGYTWIYNLIFAGIVFIMLFYNLMIYFITRETNYLYYLGYNFFILFYVYALSGDAIALFFKDASYEQNLVLLSGILALMAYVAFGRSVLEIRKHFPFWDKVFVVVILLALLSAVLTLVNLTIIAIPICFTIAIIAYTGILVIAFRLAMRNNSTARYFVIASGFYIVMLQFSFSQMLGLIPDSIFGLHANNFTQIGICVELTLFSLALGTKINEMRREAYEAQQLLLAASLENEKIVKNQNLVLEQKVQERTGELNKTLSELKATQNQLILNEKMVSMGQMMAGIAHEIKNPLNFVNNFSELSAELVEEIAQTPDQNEKDSLLQDLKTNLLKINQHGKRADSIVATMLLHSRDSGGERSETNINSLCNEFADLAYEGMKSNIPGLTTELIKSFDNGIPKLLVMQQDLSRVILNLLNNAFYAVHQRAKLADKSFQPQVKISTGLNGNNVFIAISDNGTGMKADIVKKVFEPFFTTKPTGEGTGLGLSISFDIVKAHGGELKLDSTEGEGTTFTILLPIKA